MRTADPALHERRRLEILTAAEHCFIAKGFHQASMADIAKTAGLSMGLLYRYFRNKAEIVVSFSARDREFAMEKLAEFARSTKPIAVLTQILTTLIADQAEPQASRLICEVLAEAGRNGDVRSAIQADDAALFAALEAAILTQQQAGRVTKSHSAATLSLLLMTLIDGCVGRSVCMPNFDAPAASAELMHVLKAVLSP